MPTHNSTDNVNGIEN